MSHFVLLLVMVSTFVHAGWNLLARYRKSQAVVFMWRMTHVTVLVGLVPAVVSEFYARSIPVEVWPLLAGSGVVCGFYSFFLAMGYESGDFTVVYPVARSLPVVLVGLADVLRGRSPSGLGWLGMLLVVIGCLTAPLHSFKEFSRRTYINRTSLYALLTALATVGYTVLDKFASEMVIQGPATAARYGYFFFLGNYLSLTVLRRLFRRRPSEKTSVGWALPAVGAAMGFAAYWLVLWAYQLTQRASYVVAFRQFSIVIGVVLAFAIFKEKGIVTRIGAALVITAGLIMIGVWGGAG